jgi:hypothetical protein
MINNPYEKNIKAKCVVCGKEVLIDQFGQGLCNNCGWEQDINSLDYPEKVIYPNRVSYNKAVLLFGEGRPLLPSFDDFIKMFDMYGELELKYKDRWFCLTASDGTIEFFEQKNNEIQKYESIEEFTEYANIDGDLLKKIWNEVEEAIYMECTTR